MFTAKLTNDHKTNVSNDVQTLSLSRKSGSPGEFKIIRQLNYQTTNNSYLAFGRVGSRTKLILNLLDNKNENDFEAESYDILDNESYIDICTIYHLTQISTSV